MFHYPLSGWWDNGKHVTELRKYHGKKIEKLIKYDQYQYLCFIWQFTFELNFMCFWAQFEFL